MDSVIDSVEKILNYSFKNKTPLKNAITHRMNSSSFNRLKFVGEAALPLAITNHIYLAHPTLEPKELSLLRGAIKGIEKYAYVVVKHGLHQFFLSNAEAEEEIKWFVELVGKEDNPIPYGGFVKPPCFLGFVIEALAGAVYIDINYDIKRLWEIFKPLFEPIYTLDDLRRGPHPVLSLFRWADKHGKGIEIRYTEFIKGKGTVAQVYLDNELLAQGNSNVCRETAKMSGARKAIRRLSQKGFTVETVMAEVSLDLGIKDAKKKLIEICNKRKWPNPIYSVEKKAGGAGYVCSTTIETPTEEGTLSIMGDRKYRRKIAENSSASQMIRTLTFSLKDDLET